jgi:hypothetical protein
MTQQQIPEQHETVEEAVASLRPSYEQTRDSVDHPVVREAWQQADKVKRDYHEAIESIEANEDLSDEGKLRHKAELYGNLVPQIEENYQTAREKAAYIADNEWQHSVPLPGQDKHLGNSSIKDAVQLSVVQADVQAVLDILSSNESLGEKIARRTGRKPRNLKESGDSTLDGLRTLYGEALEGGGDVEHTTRAHAVLRAAQRLGVDVDDVVSPFRSERNQQALERSRHYAHLVNQLRFTRAPTPPEQETTVSKKGVGSYGSGRVVAAGGKTRSLQDAIASRAKRRPAWK